MAESTVWLTRQTELSKLLFPLTVKFMSGVDLSEGSIISSSSVYNLHGKGEIMKALGYDCLGNAFTIPIDCNQEFSIKMMYESRLFPTVQEICKLQFTPHYITNEIQFDVYGISFPKCTVFKVLLVCFDEEGGILGLSVESLGPHPVRTLLPCQSQGNFKEYILPSDKSQTYVISQLKSTGLPLFVEFIKPISSDTSSQYIPNGTCRIEEVKICNVAYASTVIDNVPHVIAIECAKLIKIRLFQSSMTPKVEQIELDKVEWYFNHMCCKGKTSFAPYTQIMTIWDHKAGCKLPIKRELKGLKNIYSPEPSLDRRSLHDSIPVLGHYSQIMQKENELQLTFTSSKEPMPISNIHSAMTSMSCDRAVDCSEAASPLPPKKHNILSQYGSMAKKEAPLGERPFQDVECRVKVREIAFECREDCSTEESFFNKKLEANKQNILSKELHLADSLNKMNTKVTKEDHTSRKDRPVPSIRKKGAPPLPPRKSKRLKSHCKQESGNASIGDEYCTKEEKRCSEKYEVNERGLLSKELHLVDSSSKTSVQVSKKETTGERVRPVLSIRKKVPPPLPPRKSTSMKLHGNQVSKEASSGKGRTEERECLEKTEETALQHGENGGTKERLCSKKHEVNKRNLLSNELRLVDSSNDINVELAKKEDTKKIARPVPAKRKKSNKAASVDVRTPYSVARKDCNESLGLEIKEELQGKPNLRTEDKKVKGIMQTSASFEERLISCQSEPHVNSCNPQVLNETLEKKEEGCKDSTFSGRLNSVGESDAGSVHSLSSFLSKLNLETYKEKLVEEQVDMKLFEGLREMDLIDGIEMKKFEARKALLNARHGWCWSEIDTCILDNPSSQWSPNAVVKKISEDIKMPEFAEFCAINKVDGRLLVNIVDRELIQSLRDEYDMKISKIEEVKLRKFVLQGWRP